MAHRCGRGAARRRGLGRAARAAHRDRRRHGVDPVHRLSDRVGAGLQLGSRACPAGRSGDRRGSPRDGGAVRPRPGGQPEAQPAVRAQLRVPRRGSDPGCRNRLGLGAGPAVHRRGRLPEALRRQQPGDPPHRGVGRGGRGDAARALPGGVPAHRAAGRAVVGDEFLQPDPRRPRRREPVAAHPGAAGGVGLRRDGDVGLGRGPRPGGGGPGWARPGDAGHRRAIGGRAGRRGPERNADGSGGEPGRRAGCPVRQQGAAGRRGPGLADPRPRMGPRCPAVGRAAGRPRRRPAPPAGPRGGGRRRRPVAQ